MFDTEPYSAELWQYPAQANYPGTSYSDYAAKVRQRGQQWIRAINSIYPGITIMWTWGFNPVGAITDPARQTEKYGLLGSFLDGILDAVNNWTKLMDAGENAYGNKLYSWYTWMINQNKTVYPTWSADPLIYSQRVKQSFGIMMDAYYHDLGWSTTPPFSTNYFTPSTFQTSVQYALSLTDKYVWIYSENPNWWTGANLPQAYVDALRNAQQTSLRAGR